MSEAYSKRSLVEKLGIKAGARVAILNAPEGLTLGNLPDGMTPDTTMRDTYDFIQAFMRNRAELEQAFPHLKAALASNGALWISWLKGNKNPDLDENIVREIGLGNGLGAVKVIARSEEHASAL